MTLSTYKLVPYKPCLHFAILSSNRLDFFKKNLGWITFEELRRRVIIAQPKHEEALFPSGCYPQATIRTTGITVEALHSKKEKNSFNDEGGKQGKDGNWQKPRYRCSLSVEHSGVLSKSVPSLMCSTGFPSTRSLSNKTCLSNWEFYA